MSHRRLSAPIQECFWTEFFARQNQEKGEFVDVKLSSKSEFHSYLVLMSQCKYF